MWHVFELEDTLEVYVLELVERCHKEWEVGDVDRCVRRWLDEHHLQNKEDEKKIVGKGMEKKNTEHKANTM